MKHISHGSRNHESVGIDSGIPVIIYITCENAVIQHCVSLFQISCRRTCIMPMRLYNGPEIPQSYPAPWNYLINHPSNPTQYRRSIGHSTTFPTNPHRIFLSRIINPSSIPTISIHFIIIIMIITIRNEC